MIRKRKTLTPREALARLEDLCARSEQCTGEIRKKMHDWGIAQAEADNIVTDLINRRYVDDRRFAKAFVRDKLYFSRWGRRKIKMTMIIKHIDRDLIDEAIGEIDENDYMAILKKIVLAKAGTINDADTYEGRTRIFRFAVSRGFEPQLISSVIREMAAGHRS